MAYVLQVAVKNSHRSEKRGHGLQKVSVDQLVVQNSGCVGDFNRFRTDFKNSTNDRAVSIMTKELLDQLTNRGWGPVMPGDLGENITIAGEITLNVGQVVSIGRNVILQITELIEPCNKLLFLPYVGREGKAEFINTLKGRRGWYARVLTEGIICPGDPVAEVQGSKQ